MRSRFVTTGMFLSIVLLGFSDLYAQQDDDCGANECFSPELDVAYEMRPSVGWYGLTELMIAALEANLAEVKRLVEQGADIEATDDTGGTPLMWAVQGGDIDVVNFLLDSGSNVGAVGGRNATAFMLAVISGKQDIGIRLLEAGATFGGELSYQQDYLEYAAANGQPAMVGALIEHGANVEESGADALCLATKNQYSGVVTVLIEAGVDVNQRGNQGNDLPIIHALQAQDRAIVKLLVENGADLNQKDKAGRASVLYYATQTGQPSIVSYLLDNGAILGEQEANQLLSSAIYKGSVELADLFVARGATISTTHLFNAVRNQHFEMADSFADVIGIESLDDYTLDSLIEQAAGSGHQPMVDDLLRLTAARDDPVQRRLLFETVEGDHCKLSTWNPSSRVVTPTGVGPVPCDAKLFTSRRQSSLFVTQGNRIEVHSLDGSFPAFRLRIPEEEIEARLDDIRLMFAERYSGNYDWASADVVTLGYLDDGRITVITHTGGPADGTYASQFAWDGASWTLVNTQSCHRFDWICHMPGVDGQSIERWPMRRAVWHPAIQGNPGFVERVSSPQQNAVVFSFDGLRSELSYMFSGSDHCAEECTFTESVTIKPAGVDPVNLNLENSRVSIAERFLLARPYERGTRLYDLATGNDVLGEIGRASWIH